MGGLGGLGYADQPWNESDDAGRLLGGDSDRAGSSRAGAATHRYSEARAHNQPWRRVREMLLAMQKEYLIELGDAVVAVKDAGGRVKLNPLFQPVPHSTVSGMFWAR